MEGEGLFDIFESIGETVVGGLKAVGDLAMFPIDVVKGVVDIAKGKNVLDVIKETALKRIEAELKLIAVPIKLVHSVSDELGISDEVDLALVAIPGPTGALLEASQFADTIEEVIKLKKQMDKAEKEFKEFERKLEEELEKLLNEPVDEGEDAPSVKKASRSEINEYAKGWVEDETNIDIKDFSMDKLSKEQKKKLFVALVRRFLNSENRRDIARAVYGLQGELDFLYKEAESYIDAFVKQKSFKFDLKQAKKDKRSTEERNRTMSTVFNQYLQLLDKWRAFALKNKANPSAIKDKYNERAGWGRRQLQF